MIDRAVLVKSAEVLKQMEAMRAEVERLKTEAEVGSV